MGMLGLAEYFFAKYAGDENFASGLADTSFGKPISPEKTRLLKDKLILTYDKIHDGITQLPMYQFLNKELAGEQYWGVFKALVDNLAAEVEFLPLKEGWHLSQKLLKALNQLRDALPRIKMDRDKMLQMDEGIKNIQDYIWKQSKRILNIHDIRGILPDTPELVEMFGNQPGIGTWDYGPGKNPAKPTFIKNPTKPETSGQMMKRLLKEREQEEAAKGKGAK
jgi:hypothetical protein